MIPVNAPGQVLENRHHTEESRKAGRVALNSGLGRPKKDECTTFKYTRLIAFAPYQEETFFDVVRHCCSLVRTPCHCADDQLDSFLRKRSNEEITINVLTSCPPTGTTTNRWQEALRLRRLVIPKMNMRNPINNKERKLIYIKMEGNCEVGLEML